MPRTHFERAVRNTSGLLVTGYTVAVCQPGTTNPILDPVFTGPTTNAVYPNPWVAGDSINFYLDNPQVVRLVLTKAGTTEQTFYEDVQIGVPQSDISEVAQDSVAAMIVGGPGIDTFYDDDNNVYTIFATGGGVGSGGLVVTDNFDGTGTISDVAAPPPLNDPPAAGLVLSTTSGIAPVTVTADASGSSDPNGESLTFSFNWGDGSADTPFSDVAAVSHVYNAPGSYTVTVTAQDFSGATDTAVATVAVSATAAAPVARLAVTPLSGSIPLTVTADASTSTDPASLALVYSFDFRDGSGPSAFSSASSLTHTFTVAGTYRVLVTARNSAGVTSTANVVVTASVPATGVKIEMGFSGTPGNINRALQATGAPVATVGAAYAGTDLVYPKGTRGPFYTTLPSSWTTTQARMAPNGLGGFARVYVSFTSVTASTTSYAASAPAGTRFIFVHEVENGKGYATGAAYLTAYRHARSVIKAANPNVEVGMASASYAYRPGGLADVLAGNYLPGPTECDFYGVDCYQGDQNNPTTYPPAQPVQPLSVHPKFLGWYNTMLKKNPKGPNQKPWGLTEYGINFEMNFGDVQTNGLDTERATVIPKDAAYLKQEGADFWLYWYYPHNPSGVYPPTREFVDQASLKAWRTVVRNNA